MRTRGWWLSLALTALLPAQTPVVDPRGVVNGVTFELAPSTAAPGSIINIYGFNLASATVAATAPPCRQLLGAPAVEVTVNGRSAPLYFVSATQVNPQVPWETEVGPALLEVQAAVPSIFALNGGGFGPATAVSAANGKLLGPGNPPVPGDVVVLYASGLGPVRPPVASGAVGPSDTLALVARPQRAFAGGFPARVLFAGLAPGFVGLRKLTARGIKVDGSQFLSFDPANGAVTVVANPDRVQALGAGSVAGGAGAAAPVIWERNQNTNSVVAGAYAGDQLIGLVLVENP